MRRGIWRSTCCRWRSWISDFAKEQLILLLREWYMHPNGQLPAYEWALDNVNPPVHAWAALRVHQIDQKRRGAGDRAFLERVFQKLLLNFTWWVNRKDPDGRNVFQGGFLGLDNIGVFDRSAPLPTGGYLEQSDGTSWMAMYSLNMLAIATELARENPAYEDVASKFWEHFLYIAHAMSGGRNQGGQGHELWDEEDGFFYDVLRKPDGSRTPVKLRSLVGLLPLLAVQTLEPDAIGAMDGFRRRLEWFVTNRPDLTANVACMRTPGRRERRLLAILDRNRLVRVLEVMLDEREFLSPYGIRAISAIHRERPYRLHVNGAEYTVRYEPAESSTGLFGGNSNWRGPIWFPINYLIIESLQKFHHYYGDTFTVECPTGSGQFMTLAEVAGDLSRRLSRIFLRGPDGRRPVFGELRHLPERSALARSHPLPRILSRRQRCGPRRQPSNRLDSARRQASSTERGVKVGFVRESRLFAENSFRDHGVNARFGTNHCLRSAVAHQPTNAVSSMSAGSAQRGWRSDRRSVRSPRPVFDRLRQIGVESRANCLPFSVSLVDLTRANDVRIHSVWWGSPTTILTPTHPTGLQRIPLAVLAGQELVRGGIVGDPHVGAVVMELRVRPQRSNAEQHDLGQVRRVLEVA